MNSPSLPASDVARLLSLSMGQQSSQLAEALESFLPSFAQAIEQRGLDPHQDDWPTCSDFRFLANLRDSITEQAGANQPTVVSCH